MSFQKTLIMGALALGLAGCNDFSLGDLGERVDPRPGTRVQAAPRPQPDNREERVTVNIGCFILSATLEIHELNKMGQVEHLVYFLDLSKLENKIPSTQKK